MPRTLFRNDSPLGLGLLHLFHEMVNCVGMENIPVVTLATVVGQVMLYIGFAQVPWEKSDVCISAEKVLHKPFDWKVFTMSTFEHADDRHLYYNMISFVMKGRDLEYIYGGKNFAFLLAVLAIMTNMMYVALAELGFYVFEDVYYLKVCAIGFSGVIFALKVVTSCEAHPSSVINVLGIEVPLRHAAWVELILIHLVSPRASFIGHLGGILAGLVYVSTPIGALIDGTIENLTGEPLLHNDCFYNVS